MKQQGLEAQKSRSQNYGLLIEEDGRLEKIRQQRQERNKEYNEYLARKVNLNSWYLAKFISDFLILHLSVPINICEFISHA